MPTDSPTITADAAAHVLHHFGHYGIPAGGFTQQLITTIAMADPDNQSRLAAAFPDYVAAVQGAQYDPQGITHLTRLAELRCTKCGDTDGPFTIDGRCETCAGGQR